MANLIAADLEPMNLDNQFDPRKPSMAVIAYGDERGMIIWYIGADLQFEMEEGGVRDIDDLGLEPPNDGIWIWEGRYAWSPGSYEYPDDGESNPVGEFRAPTDNEWQAIREGRCPWNPEDWKLSSGVKLKKEP